MASLLFEISVRPPSFKRLAAGRTPLPGLCGRVFGGSCRKSAWLRPASHGQCWYVTRSVAQARSWRNPPSAVGSAVTRSGESDQTQLEHAYVTSSSPSTCSSRASYVCLAHTGGKASESPAIVQPARRATLSLTSDEATWYSGELRSHVQPSMRSWSSRMPMAEPWNQLFVVSCLPEL